MALHAQLSLEYRLCCLLPERPLDRSQVLRFVRETQVGESRILECITSLFSEAFGPRYFEYFKQTPPIPLLQLRYVEWMQSKKQASLPNPSLAQMLYTYFSQPQVRVAGFSYHLRQLVSTVAIPFPKEPLSWYDLANLYGDHVPSAKADAQNLLKQFPFCHVAEKLEHLYPKLQPVPEQTFRQFTAHMTVTAMEHFFAHAIPHSLKETLKSEFAKNEQLRVSLLDFISQTQQTNLQRPYQGILKERYASIKTNPLFISSLICLRLVYGLFKLGEIDANSDFILWAFHTNGSFIASLSDALYREEDRPPCFSPSFLAKQVQALEKLYEHNHELFLDHALGLAVHFAFLPEKEVPPLVQSLLFLNDSPYAQIFTQQMIDYVQSAKPVEQELLARFQELIPKEVQGRTPAYFHALPRNEQDNKRMAEFNTLLKIEEGKFIESSLYFSTLNLFRSKKCTPSHFEVLRLYGDISAHHKLIFLSAALKENPQVPKLEFPLKQMLFGSLLLVSEKKEKGISRSVQLFSRHFLNDASPSLDALRFFRSHMLTQAPPVLNQSYLKSAIEALKEIDHGLNEAQKLSIFHELLALQGKRQQLETLLVLIRHTRKIVGNLDPETLFGIVTFHPWMEQDTVARHFANLDHGKQGLASGKEEDHWKRYLEDAISELMRLLKDDYRELLLEKDPFPVSQRKERFESYLYMACFGSETTVQFLQACYLSPYADLSLPQVRALLQTSKKGWKDSLALLQEMPDFIPEYVVGKTTAFADFFQQTMGFFNQEVPGKWKGFNRSLEKIHTKGNVQARLYFRALTAYFSKRLFGKHFTVLKFLSKKFPLKTTDEKLDLLIRATQKPPQKRVVYFEHSDVLNQEKSDPCALFDALTFVSPKRKREISRFKQVYEHTILGRVLETEEAEALLLEPLRPLPQFLIEEHVASVKTLMTKTLTYPFSKKEKLKLYYTLISMQKKPQEIEERVSIVQYLEKLHGCKLPAAVVALLMTHSESFHYESLQSSLEAFEKARLAITEVSDDIKMPPELLTQLEETIFAILQELKTERSPELKSVWRSIFAAASVYNTIRHVTCTFPSSIAHNRLSFPLFSPNQALQPLCFEKPLGKLFNLSWSISGNYVTAQFVLVDADTFASSIETATLPLPAHHYFKPESFFALLKQVVLHVGYDHGDNTSFPIDTLEAFCSHPRVAPLLKTEPYHGKALEALHTFVLSIRKKMRQLFLRTSVPFSEEKKPLVGLSIYPYLDGHSILPALSNPLEPHTTLSEIKELDFASIFEKCLALQTEFTEEIRRLKQARCEHWEDAITKYLQAMSPNTVQLNINLLNERKENETFQASLTVYFTLIAYHDRVYHKLEQKKDMVASPAIGISLVVGYLEESIQKRMIYPLDELKTEEDLQKCISWQIALLKLSLHQKMSQVQTLSDPSKRPHLSLNIPALPFPLEISANIALYSYAELTITTKHRYFPVTARANITQPSELPNALKTIVETIHQELLEIDDLREHAFFQMVGSGNIYVENSRHYLFSNEPPIVVPEKLGLAFSTASEMERFCFSDLYRAMTQYSSVRFTTDLLITENLKHLKTVALNWQTAGVDDDIIYQVELPWMWGFIVESKVKAHFFMTRDLMKIPLSLRIASLKSKVYQTLHSLQTFIQDLQNKKDAFWVYPSHTYSLQISVQVQEDVYCFTFIGQRENEIATHKQTAPYDELTTEADILKFLHTHLSTFPTEVIPNPTMDHEQMCHIMPSIPPSSLPSLLSDHMSAYESEPESLGTSEFEDIPLTEPEEVSDDERQPEEDFNLEKTLGEWTSQFLSAFAPASPPPLSFDNEFTHFLDDSDEDSDFSPTSSDDDEDFMY